MVKIVDVEFHYSYYLPWHLWPFLEKIDRVEIPYNSIHLFDLIRSIFGMPEGVFAYSNTHPKYPKLSDTKTTAILKYRKDLRCALSLNHCYSKLKLILTHSLKTQKLQFYIFRVH